MIRVTKIGSDNCGSCGKMSHYDQKVIEELGYEFEYLKYGTDAYNDSELVDELRDKVGSIDYPTYVITNSDHYVDHFVGASDKGRFRQRIHALVKDVPSGSIRGDGCETKYETDGGIGESDSSFHVVTGIDQKRDSNHRDGDGNSLEDTSEVWRWEGKELWSKHDVQGHDFGELLTNEVKKDGKVYKPGKQKYVQDGGTFRRWTWEIEQCDEEEPDGGDGGGGDDKPPPKPEDPCKDVECEDCEECEDGKCVFICKEGEECHEGKCREIDPCRDVECPECHECVDGDCIYKCKGDAVCVDGCCVEFDPIDLDDGPWPNLDDYDKECAIGTIQIFWDEKVTGGRYGVRYDTDKISDVELISPNDPDKRKLKIRFRDNTCIADCEWTTICSDKTAEGGQLVEGEGEIVGECDDPINVPTQRFENPVVLADKPKCSEPAHGDCPDPGSDSEDQFHWQVNPSDLVINTCKKDGFKLPFRTGSCDADEGQPCNDGLGGDNVQYTPYFQKADGSWIQGKTVGGSGRTHNIPDELEAPGTYKCVALAVCQNSHRENIRGVRGKTCCGKSCIRSSEWELKLKKPDDCGEKPPEPPDNSNCTAGNEILENAANNDGHCTPETCSEFKWDCYPVSVKVCSGGCYDAYWSSHGCDQKCGPEDLRYKLEVKEPGGNWEELQNSRNTKYTFHAEDIPPGKKIRGRITATCGDWSGPGSDTLNGKEFDIEVIDCSPDPPEAEEHEYECTADVDKRTIELEFSGCWTHDGELHCGNYYPQCINYVCCQDCPDEVPPYEEGDNDDCDNRPEPEEVPGTNTRQKVYLYDRLNHTYVFCCPIKTDVTWLLPYDAIPPVFQRYITASAAVRAAVQMVDNPQLYQLLKDRENQLRMECMNYELEQGDLNFLGQPDYTTYVGYQPIQTLNR